MTGGREWRTYVGCMCVCPFFSIIFSLCVWLIRYFSFKRKFQREDVTRRYKRYLRSGHDSRSQILQNILVNIPSSQTSLLWSSSWLELSIGCKRNSEDIPADLHMDMVPGYWNNTDSTEVRMRCRWEERGGLRWMIVAGSKHSSWTKRSKMRWEKGRRQWNEQMVRSSWNAAKAREGRIVSESGGGGIREGIPLLRQEEEGSFSLYVASYFSLLSFPFHSIPIRCSLFPSPNLHTRHSVTTLSVPVSFKHQMISKLTWYLDLFFSILIRKEKRGSENSTTLRMISRVWNWLFF